MELEELYKKYGVLTDGLQRRYVINVMDRPYDLDFATPFELSILVPKEWENDSSSPNKYVQKNFIHRAWTRILEDLVLYLLEKAPKSKEELIAFRTDWSKAAVFGDYKMFANIIPLREDLYLSINYTSTHFMWVIGDLIRFFGLEYGFVVVHKTPEVEPREIKEELGKVRREEFKNYLMSKYQKSEESANKIINNIDSLNKVLGKMGTTYNDFFLFDDPTALSNFKSRLLLDYRKYTTWNDHQLETAQRYLDYITNFYTKLKKEAKDKLDNLGLCIVENKNN